MNRYPDNISPVLKTVSARKALLGCGAALAVLIMASNACAQQRDFDLPSETATKAIPEFARQAGVQIIASGADLRDVKTRAVKGQIDARAALAQMLEGTNLAVASDDGKVITLKKVPQSPPAPAGAGTASAAPSSDTSTVVVVTGIRAGLRAALEEKRSSDQIVDAVTATDVGKFPDANIADSLQRISGVAIQRNGGEGQFITVRGLGPEFNNVLVNGRTMATDNQGREFSFDTLSSTIISRAEVFKTSQPDLQEGGIGSTVNIQTARPLDRKGLHLTLQAGVTDDALAKKTSPDASGVFSYSNDNRTWGVVAAISYKERKSQDDYTDTNGWFAVAPGANTVQLINGTPQSTGLTPSAYSYLAPAGSSQTVFIPQNLNFRRSAVDSKRLTSNITFQGKLSDTVMVTVDALASSYKVIDDQSVFAGYFTPPYFSNLTYDSNGTVTGFYRPGLTFNANNPALGASNQQNDNFVTSVDRNSKSYQVGGNIKWQATNSLKFEGDISKSGASQDLYSPFVVVGSNPANAPQFQLNGGDSLPSYINTSSITDPSILRAHYINVSDSKYKDDITEVRVQGEYAFTEGVLKSLQFGGLYSDREKRDTEYSTPGANYCTYCGYAVTMPTNLVQPYYLSDYLKKAGGSGGVPSQFFTFSGADIISYLSQPSVLATRSAGEQTNVPTATFLATGGYTPVLKPGQGFDVTEKVFAEFINSKWKGDGWSGNVGVRITDTTTTSIGVVQPLLKIQQNVGDSNLNFTYGPSASITVKNHYIDVLPSANLKVDLSPNLVARLAASRTLTRPTLSDLGTNNSYSGRVTAASSTGGNPYLTPFTSWNYDASMEWYASRNVFLSGNLFRKNFSGFITQQTVFIPRAGLDSSGNPVTYNFADTRSRNGNSGSITGAELATQYAFDDTSVLSGFGVAANYTYVDSVVKTKSPTDCSSLEGLSKNSYNINGFYEKNGIQARLAYNWRSSFLAKCYGQLTQPESTKAYGQLDFDASYDVSPSFQIYLQGVNLTDQYTYQYSIYLNRFLRLEDTGTRISLGVRWKY